MADSSDRHENIVEDLQRHLEDGWLGVGEVVERLRPDELRVLRDKPTARPDFASDTLDRLLALVEMAERRRDREPDPWGGSVQAIPQGLLAPHGTVAHEVTRLRLLLIGFDPDDTLRILQLIEGARDTEFEVRSADRVEDAPDFLRDEAVDVALLNLTRPAASGPALLARAEVVTSEVPVISLINAEDEAQVIHLGARDYLVKSQLDSRLLVRTLRTAVEHRRLVEELETSQRREHFFATRDSMTGLANRHHFREQLERAIHFAERHGHNVAVLFVDLDRFKEINDTLGHEVGDSLLITLAERLSGSLRRSDLVARIGGDEFLLMLQGTDQDYVPTRTAERLLDSVATPFVVDGQEHVLSASIGVSTYPRDGRDSETLIRCADAAMYQAKSSGRNAYRFYSQSVNAVAVRKRTVESRLRHAVERGELCLAYQPRVDARNGRIVGAEALMRWNDAELGIIDPIEFVPIAEDSGLLDPIGEWAMIAACEQQSEWAAAGFPDVRIAVNVSPRQIRSASVRDAVASALAKTGIGLGRLEIEVSESTLVNHCEAAAAILGELAELGVGVVLDDFGTGYSSLGFLQRFPVSTLKIERSFVCETDPAANGPSVVDAIISIARTLDLGVVASGVETLEQRDHLIARGCHEMQGFLFSAAIHPDRFLQLLRSGPLEPAG